MKLADFDYSLPRELIAQYPLKERDSARLLVLNRKTRTIQHCLFRDILDYFNKGELLVLNNTKVLPARLKGVRATGGKVEILLLGRKSRLTPSFIESTALKRRPALTFAALIRPSRLKPGEKIALNGGKTFCIIGAKNEVTFPAQDLNSVYDLGVMPLPPYIKRNPEDLDSVYYQTVYARESGSIASPTAGLHFTEALMKKLESLGIDIAQITLHINYSTFKPVEVDDITQHKMEPEYFKIPEESLERIEKAHRDKTRIFAVGTTSLRVLEAYGYDGKAEGYTDLFIYPGYKFNMVSCLLTNFHLPRTTLFMLVCAFAGTGLIKKAYQEAVNNRYRFYSYGDAMLII